MRLTNVHASQKGFGFVTFGQDMSVQRNRGFTLFEIMVTLAIIGILAAAGYPALTTVVSNSRMNKAASTMVLAIGQARSQAIAGNGFVSLVAGSKDSPVTKVTVPATESAGVTAWSNGWRLLLRPLEGTPAKLATTGATATLLGQEYLGFVPGKSTSLTLHYMKPGENNLASSAVVGAISFDKLGQMVDENGSTLTNDIQIWVCDGGRVGERGRRIVINRRGIVRNLLVGATGYANPCT